MASTSETGHAKNIDNFKILISSVAQLGTAYNPAQTSIQIPALNALLANANAASAQLADARRGFDQATNTRATLFESLSKRSTRIVSTMELSGVEAKTLDNAKSLAKKIQGSRISPSSVAAQADPASPAVVEQSSISTSRQSYAVRLENFSLLLGLAAAQPAYSSNEPELQIAGLNAYYSDLNLAHSRVIDTDTQVAAALTARNAVLYAEGTGLVDIVLLVKKYVRTLNLTDNQLVKAVLSLEFRRI